MRSNRILFNRFTAPPIFQQRRVVVTGLGMVSPLGNTVEKSWNALLNGKCGIQRIQSFDPSLLGVQIAGEVKRSTDENDQDAFVMSQWISKKDYKSQSVDFIALSMCTATQALEDAKWKPETEEQKYRTGVAMGAGIGNLPEMVENGVLAMENKVRKISPFFIPRVLINLAAGHVSITHGLKGPNHACVTACATSSHAIGDAFRMIQRGDADVMVAGGTECSINEISIVGFHRAKALASKFNDRPQESSRPFDKDRAGFVMGEGGGAMVLEDYEHAVKRGAKIYAEIRGYGLSGDAHHITAPRADGDGAYRAMKSAIDQSGLEIEDFDYINAHGTSTPLGDSAENTAIKRAFGKHAYNMTVSSTKGATGHLLGGTGAVEAIFAVKSICEKIAPPTLNLHNRTEEFDLNYAPLEAQKLKKVDAVLSNSFGFGGTNSTLCFSRV